MTTAPDSSLAGFARRRASAHLDMIRGLAAFAVLIYHVRYRFFVDFSEVSQPGVMATAWYFVTAFGHDAVIVFFVLSGFLIGSSVYRAHRDGRWHPLEYAGNRLIRLLLVLVPGLLLTAVWDGAGLHWFGNAPIYTGAPQSYFHDFFNVAARLTPGTLLGNLAFVQTILVPPFGSNEALWSLAFEGWYYVLFPMLVAVVMPSRSLGRRIMAGAGAVGVAYLVGPTIRAYFLFWLAGAVLALAPAVPILSRWPRMGIATAFAMCVASVSLAHVGRVKALLGSLWAADAVTAVTFTVCVFACLHDRRPSSADWYSRAAAWVAGCSYTLYLVHLPLLVFVRAWLNPGPSWQPMPAAILTALAIAAGALVYAYGIARLTEARTDAVRRRVFAWFGRPVAPIRPWGAGVAEAREQRP